jgi:hypothetical protein
MRVSSARYASDTMKSPSETIKSTATPVFVRDLQESTYEGDDYQQRSSDCRKH